MPELLLNRELVELTSSQDKMIKSGWGEGAIENSIVERITYLSDGLKVKGYLAYPKDQNKKYPCVIWCRGGIGNAGVIDNFNAKGIFGQLASWGYVVFAPQYRGNDGGEGVDNFGGDDINDILNLIPLAEEIEYADNTLWAIEGWSRGGMMTYLALTKTNLFKAAVVIGGIADLECNADESSFMRKLFQSKIGRQEGQNFQGDCYSRSIINFPEKLSKSTPMLILHGTADNRVPAHHSLDVSYKLLDLKIPFRLVLLEEGDHFLKSHRKEVDRLRKEWYDKYLQ